MLINIKLFFYFKQWIASWFLMLYWLYYEIITKPFEIFRNLVQKVVHKLFKKVVQYCTIFDAWKNIEIHLVLGLCVFSFLGKTAYCKNRIYGEKKSPKFLNIFCSPLMHINRGPFVPYIIIFRGKRIYRESFLPFTTYA